MARTPVAEETFYHILRRYLGIDAPVDATALLVEDLGLDSIQLFEIALLLEDVGNHLVPDEVLSGLATAGDVYELYALYCGHE